VAKSLTNLGSCLIEQALCRRGAAFASRPDIREHSPPTSEISASLNELAEVYNRQARYAEAEPLYLRALAINEKTLGDPPRHRHC
jgi:tetratricopeptide (TPR) repeat protein